MRIIKSVFLLLFGWSSSFAQTPPGKEVLYVGTFSVRGSKGIYVYDFDRTQGTLHLRQTVQSLESPSFLEVHPSGRYVYSVNRESIKEKPGSGSVSAYLLDQKTGFIKLLNSQPSYGLGPCHISVDKTGKLAFISNYGEGNMVVLPIKGDGSLGPASDSVRHTGRSINTQRQEKPHVHSAILSPDNRFVFVSDLGTDKIYTYEVDTKKGKIKPALNPFVMVTPGAGPRHFTFHPNGKYAYIAEELTSSVGVFAYQPQSGVLNLVADTVRALPNHFTQSNTSADIHVNPQGTYLYLSNRGHNSLSVYKIISDGKLTLQGHQSAKGQTPRNFWVDPLGEFVIVANQDSDTIEIFRVNKQTGMLIDTGNQIQVPSPVCLKMVNLNMVK